MTDENSAPQYLIQANKDFIDAHSNHSTATTTTTTTITTTPPLQKTDSANSLEKTDSGKKLTSSDSSGGLKTQTRKSFDLRGLFTKSNAADASNKRLSLSGSNVKTLTFCSKSCQYAGLNLFFANIRFVA